MGNSSSSSGGKRAGHRGRGDDGNSSSYGRLSSSSGRFAAPGPPQPPGKPYLLVASPADEPDVITVKWKPPVHDGGSKITGYVVEHRRTISPHWVKATPGKVRHDQLTLSGLEPGWRYQFRVKAVNSSGHSPPSAVSDPVTMTVHRAAVVAPVFVRGIDDRVALENDQVKFVVEFEGTPAPKISWYKDGFELFSNRRQRVNTDNGVSTLYIHQAEYSDEGEIKCSATNRAGHAITKARLRLEAPPMVRLPQDYEEGLLLEQNEPMRLKVSVSGRPLPQVTWLHDGEEIRGGDRFEVIHTDKYAALKLACVKRSDRGCYQIQAVNPLGEHMASFLVTVTDRPSPPGKVHVSKTSGRSVTLSWKPPEDDGGCKIGNYIIEYNRVGWDMWLKASTSRHLTADLDDLLEGSEYRFRVKAENPYGISVPSEVSEPIFLPDIRRGIYKPVNTGCLLSEDEEKLVKIQETKILEYFSRKSRSPEPSSRSRKLSVDEVSPPVPKRRKKKTNAAADCSHSSETDVYKSFSYLDVSSAETWQQPQPIEQKDHWGLSPGLKSNDSRMSAGHLPVTQTTPSDYKTKGNSTDSLSLFNFERGSAPPISLSSPELGAESEGFEEYIRNSYSSSELLYERNLNRFNGYSNDDRDNSSSEAQKIAIYAMDRKNSLRQSPITRRSNDGSEEKSIFNDSDSIQSVVDLSSSRANAGSSFASLTNSHEEEIESTSHGGAGPESDFGSFETSEGSDDERSSSSDGPGGQPVTFGSGKRALEHDAPSAFFSTAVYDDDYLSSSSDRHRSKSASPADRSDVPSRDPLANSVTSVGGDRPRPEDDDDDDGGEKVAAEHSSPPPTVNGGTSSYRPRDGIPKYVMLPNPYYRDSGSARAANSPDRTRLLRLSSDSGGMVVPPEIPCRRDATESAPVTASGAPRLPVITVTETGGGGGGGDGDGEEDDDGGSPILKKIFVPSLARPSGRDYSPPRTEVAETVAAVKHYGDIVERYSGMAAKKTGSKTYYLDFEQLRMAAAVEGEPVEAVVEPAGAESDGTSEYDDDDDDDAAAAADGAPREQDDRPTCDGDGRDPTTAAVDDDDSRLQLAVAFQETAARQPDAVPYLQVFGNLSLALFGYWLYTCKDEKLSVPVFGFLLFRFFKTQVWDRI